VRKDGRLFEDELDDRETPLTVSGRVTDAVTGAAVQGAVLDVWQADSQGNYDEAGFHLRGLIPVNDDGSYVFHTALPEGYPIPARGPTTEFLGMIGQQSWRPAHIHLRVHVGNATRLQTQVFIARSRFLDSDPVNAVHRDLVADHFASPDQAGRVMRFDIRLALSGARTFERGSGPRSAHTA